MSSSTRVPDVKETYFQHKVLTKIIGKPTYASLKLLSTEITANAASVTSTLGGGFYGHLGLVLTPAKYASMPNAVPWETPVPPGPFLPPTNGTGPQIEAAKDVWRELKYSFELNHATEKALVAQLVASIDSMYLRALINRDTGQYSHTIQHVLEHLFATHGKITPQQLESAKQTVSTMQFDISQPVDSVFNAIADLCELAEYANNPLTEQQKIALAYLIFSKHDILKDDLRTWNHRPEKTWSSMTIHFREAQADLLALPTAGDLYHQQANSISEITDSVIQRLMDMELDETPPTDAPPPLVPVDPSTIIPANWAAFMSHRPISDAHRARFFPPGHPAAAGTSNPADGSAIALASQMAEMITLLRTNSTPPASSTTTTSRSTAGRSAQQNTATGRRDNGRGRGRTSTVSTRLYCWSHGSCAHANNDCRTKLPGHPTGATFANMMGGSTHNCYWIPGSN